MATYNNSNAYFYSFGSAETFNLNNNECRMGTGAQFQIGANYYLNENFGLGLEAGYLLSTNPMNKTGARPYLFYNEWGEVDYIDGFVNSEQKGSALFVAPMIYAAVKPSEDSRLYAGIGANIGLATVTVTNEGYVEDYYGDFEPVQSASEARLTGGLATGGRFALGGDFFFSEMVGLYAEGVFSAMTYAPTKGEYQSYDLNGASYLDNISHEQWEFVENPSEASTLAPMEPGAPIEEYVTAGDDLEKKVRTQIYSFSSISFNLGVKFRF